MKVLVTGGAGYLGSILVPELLAAGHAVTVADNLLFRQATLLDCCGSDRFEFVRGDCRDERVVGGLVREADLIIPLAALVGAPLCDQDRFGATSTNLDAVRLLLKLSSKNQTVIFPTTNSGYGVATGKICTEDTPLNPISLYGETKCRAEQAILERGNAVTLRLATVFGVSPKMRLDLLVNDFVYRAVNDRAVVIFEGHFKRNYIHVRDVAKVFLHAIGHFEAMKNRPYNVGLEDANLSKLELCALIRGQIPSFVFLEAPIGEDPDKRDYVVSNQRILATGYRPDWTIARGIGELVKAYRIIKRREFGNV